MAIPISSVPTDGIHHKDINAILLFSAESDQLFEFCSIGSFCGFALFNKDASDLATFSNAILATSPSLAYGD